MNNCYNDILNDANLRKLSNQWLASLRSWHVACPQEQRVSALVSGMSVPVFGQGRQGAEWTQGPIFARIYRLYTVATRVRAWRRARPDRSG